VDIVSGYDIYKLTNTQDMALFQLIYMSSLVTDEPELLPSILEASVRNNKRRDITGMMLYSDGSVLQVLEGERSIVMETFRAIESDGRHSGIFILIEQEIAARHFASWSMGFRHLSAADLERLPVAAHVFKARDDEIALRGRAGEALTILQSFGDGTMSVV
jgi:hypothetical protein